jgi:hypothetical protein
MDFTTSLFYTYQQEYQQFPRFRSPLIGLAQPDGRPDAAGDANLPPAADRVAPDIAGSAPAFRRDHIAVRLRGRNEA